MTSSTNISSTEVGKVPIKYTLGLSLIICQWFCAHYIIAFYLLFFFLWGSSLNTFILRSCYIHSDSLKPSEIIKSLQEIYTWNKPETLENFFFFISIYSAQFVKVILKFKNAKAKNCVGIIPPTHFFFKQVNYLYLVICNKKQTTKNCYNTMNTTQLLTLHIFLPHLL